MVRVLVSDAVRTEVKAQFARVKTQVTKEANKELVRLLAPAEKHERGENQMQQMQHMMYMLMGENNREEDHEEDVSADVRNKRMDVAEKLAKIGRASCRER